MCIRDRARSRCGAGATPPPPRRSAAGGCVRVLPGEPRISCPRGRIAVSRAFGDRHMKGPDALVSCQFELGAAAVTGAHLGSHTPFLLEELEAVEGVGAQRARTLRDGLSRLAEISVVERYA